MLVNGVRSLVECATLCHANDTCQAAVYQEFNKCLLIGVSMEEVDLGSDGDAKLIDFRKAYAEVNSCHI